MEAPVQPKSLGFREPVLLHWLQYELRSRKNVISLIFLPASTAGDEIHVL